MRSRPLEISAGVVAGAVLSSALWIGLGAGSGVPPAGTAPSPSPSPAASGAPPASPSAAPQATPSPWPTPAPSLRVGGLAAVEADAGVRLRASPGGLWLRGPAGAVVVGFGRPVFLDAHRVDGEGTDWWAVAPVGDAWAYGWAAGRDGSGRATLAPVTPSCPDPDRLTPATLRGLSDAAALACFGGRELSVRGRLSCERSIADFAVGGVSWLDPNHSCTLDGEFSISGPGLAVVLALDSAALPSEVPVRVRAHYDDPEARQCFRTDIGVFADRPVAPPEPPAVLLCRQTLVADLVTPLP